MFKVTFAGLVQANIVPALLDAKGRLPGIPWGAGVAMSATMGYGTFVAGPPAIGLLADAIGLRQALFVLAGCALAVAIRACAAERQPAQVSR
jgi:hypothetical protein